MHWRTCEHCSTPYVGAHSCPPPRAATLRPYQAAAIQELRRNVTHGKRAMLLVSPTGSGKTLTAAEIMRSAVAKGSRVLFVVHLRELVDQTVESLRRLGHERVGVMRGDDKRKDPDAPVQVASIQTLGRRTKPPADIVILDEAHRSIAGTYEKHIWEAYPNATIIGLTATPCRGDGRGLGERYEVLVEASTYADLIKQGFISEPIVYAPEHAPDLSGVRRVAGDFVLDQLENAMQTLVGDIIGEWQRRAAGRKTIVFACGIRHSQDIVQRFREAGVRAEHLDGETPALERKGILERLASGETQVVSNCAVLTEGFDCPSIRCAILARPTLSLVLHRQTVGRVLRIGEVPPIVLDHAGNVARHGLPTEDIAWSLDGNGRAKAKSEHKVCKQCFAYYGIGETACPYCGYEPPIMPRELPTEVGGELVVVDEAKTRRDYYDRHVATARARGFKPGYPAAKYKEKFNEWPPWSWSRVTKAAYAVDEIWQENERNHAEWKARWAPKPAAPSEPANDTSNAEPEYEHAFAGLIDV